MCVEIEPCGGKGNCCCGGWLLEEFLISGDSIFRPNYLVLSGRDSWGRNVVKRGRRFHKRKKR